MTADRLMRRCVPDGLPRLAQEPGLPLSVVLVPTAQDWRIALSAALPVLIALPVFPATSHHRARPGLSRRALDELRGISVRMVTRLTAPMALFAMIVLPGVPLVIWMEGILIGQRLTPSTAITVLILMLVMCSPLMALLVVREVLRMTDASLIRMDRVLTAAALPATRVPEAGRAERPKGFRLGFDGVSFGYQPETRVLKNISFTLPERSMTAIVGASGSGKSSILNLIPGFWDASGVRISIGDNIAH